MRTITNMNRSAMAARERKAQMPYNRNDSTLIFESLDLPVAVRQYTADAVLIRSKKPNLESYELMKDEISGEFICPFPSCGEHLSVFDDLIKHLYYHSDRVSCPMCGTGRSDHMRFDLQSLNNVTQDHLERHLPAQNYCSVADCKQKGKSYTTRNMEKHMKTVHGMMVDHRRPYPCTVDECAYRALNTEELAGHLLVQHGIGEGRTKRHRCEYGCGAEFLYRTQRQRHQNEGKCPKKKNFVVHECPICYETFYNYDAKYNHLKIVHRRSDEIADILKKAAGVDLLEVEFKSAIERNLIGEEL